MSVEHFDWRLYSNLTGPTVALANENTKPTLPDNTSIIRLRANFDVVSDDDKNATVIIEYSTTGAFAGEEVALGASNHWDWANGADTEGDSFTVNLLTSSTRTGDYVESSTSQITFKKSFICEFDFSIVPTSNVLDNQTYYFRVTSSGWGVFALYSGKTWPQVLTAAAAGPTSITIPQATATLTATGAIQGGHTVVNNVAVAQAPLLSTGTISGSFLIIQSITIPQPTFPATATISGGFEIIQNVSVAQEPLPVVGSISAGFIIDVLIAQDPLLSTGTISGGVDLAQSVNISQDPLIAIGTITGGFEIILVVDTPQDPLTATGLISAGVQQDYSPVIAQDPLTLTGAIEGVSAIGGIVIVAQDPLIGTAEIIGRSARLITENFEATGFDYKWWDSTTYHNVSNTLDPNFAHPYTPPADAGSKCLKIVETRTGSSIEAINDITTLGDQLKTFNHFDFYSGGLNLGVSDSTYIFLLQDGGAFVIGFYIRNDSGVLNIYGYIWNNNTNEYHLLRTFQDFTRFRLEFKYDKIADEYEFRINGQTYKAGSLVGTTRTPDVLWVGPYLCGNSLGDATIYYDRIQLDTLDWVGEAVSSDILISQPILAATGSVSAGTQFSVATPQQVLEVTGSINGASQLSVLVPQPILTATGAIQGTGTTADVVTIPQPTLLLNAIISGSFLIAQSVNISQDPLTAIGSITGLPIIVNNVTVAQPILTLTGNITGSFAIQAPLIISQPILALTGNILGTVSIQLPGTLGTINNPTTESFTTIRGTQSCTCGRTSEHTD